MWNEKNRELLDKLQGKDIVSIKVELSVGELLDKIDLKRNEVTESRDLLQLQLKSLSETEKEVNDFFQENKWKTADLS